MSKIKIPKNWSFKYYIQDGEIIKYAFEDEKRVEHIYINQEIEQETPSYDDFKRRIDKALKWFDYADRNKLQDLYAILTGEDDE